MSDGTIPVFQEIGSGSNGQRSDEDDFVKVDNLPLQLTVMCEVCVSWCQQEVYVTVVLMGCLVSQGGASEENSGGAAEQQPVHGDPQRER